MNLLAIPNQYSRYTKACARAHVIPHGFARFILDVYPYTVFN